MTSPIYLIIQTANEPLFECPNYTGYIPRVGNWVKIDAKQAGYRVVNVLYKYDSKALVGVEIYVADPPGFGG